MKKNYAVIGKGKWMDVEIAVNDFCYDAIKIYNDLKETNNYTQIYIVDNETGELYRTYDVTEGNFGIQIIEWAKKM